MSAARRPFRIETPSSAGAAVDLFAVDGLDDQLHRIFGELAGVREEIARFKARDPAVDRERDRNVLWAGIETIQDAIQHTKHEIASLHAEGARGEKLLRATSELEAVVTDTEEATEAILTSAERVDALMLQMHALVTGDAADLASEIQNETTKIFEACNFQDITGQRIRKVVKLLLFIEERVARMTDIWGGADVVAQGARIIPREGDEALLNGPALADDVGVVSQDDIDSLFA